MRAEAATAAKGKRSLGREVPPLRPTGRFGPQAGLLQLRLTHYKSHRATYLPCLLLAGGGCLRRPLSLLTNDCLGSIALGHIGYGVDGGIGGIAGHGHALARDAVD